MLSFRKNTAKFSTLSLLRKSSTRPSIAHTVFSLTYTYLHIPTHSMTMGEQTLSLAKRNLTCHSDVEAKSSSSGCSSTLYHVRIERRNATSKALARKY